MSIQGKKATLLPNQAENIVVDGGFSLRLSTEDSDTNWQWLELLYEDWHEDWEEQDDFYDPWYGCEDGVWNGSEWIPDDDGLDYGWDDYDDRDDFVDYFPDFDYDYDEPDF
jgi:hypothetical protein